LTTVGSGCKAGDEDDDNSSKDPLLEFCLEEVLVAVVVGGGCSTPSWSISPYFCYGMNTKKNRG
jgi:hypothetical protein